jgi:hypothetical protein
MSRPAASKAVQRLIDRSQTEMPEGYMPSAGGVMIVGGDMLRAAGRIEGISGAEHRS